MTATLIVLLVSVLLFVATEYFFPVDDSSLSRRQRHFWSIILFLSSLVTGISIKGAYDTKHYMESIAAVFRKIGDPAIEKAFQDMYVSYNGPLFTSAHPAIKKWAQEAITTLSNELTDGYIRIPATRAPDQIGSVYSDAREFIVATNVGGTKAYFDVPSYRAVNRTASRRGIPIVRLWLYDANRPIQLRQDAAPRRVTRKEFDAEVSALQDSLESVASIVVDLDKVRLAQARDVLLLDNAFLAETDLSREWTLNSARATAKPDAILEIRHYLTDVFDRSNQDAVFLMPDEEVRQRFDRYRYLKGSKRLAEQVLDDIMSQVRVQ